MRNIFGFIFMLLSLNVTCQVIENDTLIFNKSKRIPCYVVDTCVAPLLKRLVDNCGADATLSGYRFGFWFYSRKKDSCYFVTIKPIVTSCFYHANFYGAFVLYGKSFYCIGENLDILRKNLNKDSIEIKYRPPRPKNQSVVIDMDILSDLNTIDVVKSITLNNKSYFFFIQPCTNMSKKTLRKIKKINPHCN